MNYIRQTGNDAAHSQRHVTRDQAALCLENLYDFMDFVACCYGQSYTQGTFNPALLETTPETAAPSPAPAPEVDLAALMAENQALRQELTARRAAQQPSYTPRPLELSEYKTRKLYIDALLTDAGWTEGKDWVNEVVLPGMPNNAGEGRADYVLYDDSHRPLAVIEAKRTCVDPAKGRQQVKLYADILERQSGRRPVIFLTNGFDTYLDDGVYPERKVAAFYSNAGSGEAVQPPGHADQPVLHRSEPQHCRPMVPGRRHQSHLSGVPAKPPESAAGDGDRLRKTRTVIALCDVLLRHGWVKNILFLADRNSLVTQAKRSFVNLLPRPVSYQSLRGEG